MPMRSSSARVPPEPADRRWKSLSPAEALAAAGWLVWGVVIYLGLVMTAVGYGIWYRLLGLYRVNQVMPFLMLHPVTTMISGVLLLDETITAVTALGAVIVIAGVGFITIRSAENDSN